MRLYGRALADQVPANTTGHQARLMFGLMTESLAGAYETLTQYSSTGWAGLISPAVDLTRDAIDGDAINAARQYLDSTNEMLQGYFPHMPASDDVLTDQQLQELRASVRTSSTAVHTIDDLFSTTWLDELSDSLVEACGTVSAKVAGAVAKVGGSFIGGAWWLIALALGGLYLWHRWGHRLFT